MDVKQSLLEQGFARVIALDGAPWGGGTLLLALWAYEAEAQPAASGAWIHPYYFASQQAYMAASEVTKRAQAAGVGLAMRDEIRVKPIFACLPGFSQGRNTLSYVDGLGSRFHVQILLAEDVLPFDLTMEDAPHPLHCGECRACIDACPSGALDEDGFHREKCLRNWMMSGQPVPEALRPLMGNRLMGCDECQRCCPHNPPPAGKVREEIPLAQLLGSTKASCAMLRQSIGANMAIPNRVLGQACLIAGCSGDASLLPELTRLASSPSPVVSTHAAWAANALSVRKTGCAKDENTL
ncbi:MAG: hypothetical protein IKK21_04955 [Clostridia bacterium]|nr:hypothetical protein [Clostridia bacterium]